MERSQGNTVLVYDTHSHEAIPAGVVWRGDLLCELLNIRLRTTDVYKNIK